MRLFGKMYAFIIHVLSCRKAGTFFLSLKAQAFSCNDEVFIYFIEVFFPNDMVDTLVISMQQLFSEMEVEIALTSPLFLLEANC